VEETVDGHEHQAEGIPSLNTSTLQNISHQVQYDRVHFLRTCSVSLICGMVVDQRYFFLEISVLNQVDQNN
jgi:hypothetical protein